MAKFLAVMVQQRTEVGADALARFESILAAKVDELLESGGGHASLSVDYDPDRTLSDAAREAGLDVGVWPWKSSVSVYMGGEVKARYGYGGEWVRIFPVDPPARTDAPEEQAKVGF